jgi:hypothetical protein
MLLEYLRARMWERRTRRTLRLFLADQLNRTGQVLAQIIELYGQANDVPPLQLIDLAQVAIAFQPYRNQVYVVRDDQARNEVLNFIARLERVAYYTPYVRQWITDLIWGNWAKDQMNKQIQEIRDLSNALQRLRSEVLPKVEG